MKPKFRIIDFNSPKKWTSFLIKTLAQCIHEKKDELLKPMIYPFNRDDHDDK